MGISRKRMSKLHRTAADARWGIGATGLRTELTSAELASVLKAGAFDPDVKPGGIGTMLTEQEWRELCASLRRRKA